MWLKKMLCTGMTASKAHYKDQDIIQITEALSNPHIQF